MMKSFSKKVLLVALLLAGAFFTASINAVSAAEDKNVKWEQIIAKVNPMVVSITVNKPIQKFRVTYREYPELGIVEGPIYEILGGPDTEVIGAGTGFVVDNSGYVVTNNHVLSDATVIYMVTLSSGDSRQAQAVYQDKEHDIAVLKIDGTYFPVLLFGDSDSLRVDDQVITIGNALGKNTNVAVGGIVSKLNQKIVVEDKWGNEGTYENLIQTNVRIRKGYSGSPLLNLNGEVVGIIVAAADGTLRPNSFALLINPIKEIVEKVLGR